MNDNERETANGTFMGILGVLAVLWWLGNNGCLDVNDAYPAEQVVEQIE